MLVNCENYQKSTLEFVKNATNFIRGISCFNGKNELADSYNIFAKKDVSVIIAS